MRAAHCGSPGCIAATEAGKLARHIEDMSEGGVLQVQRGIWMAQRGSRRAIGGSLGACSV
jgi:hypothetical protein